MLNKFTINHIREFIKNKIKEKEKIVNHSVDAKYLTIIACHIDNTEKMFFLKKNIEFLSFPHNDVIVINTSNLKLNNLVQSEIAPKVFKYMEITNNGWLDFGKWGYVLNNIDYSGYEFITFTNDSFIICESILYFYYQAIIQSVDLFAYTSSTEVKYHYQSYLFIVKRDAIKKFLNYIEIHVNIRPNPVLLEINLYNIFTSKHCFLDIGNLHVLFKKNIFFNTTGLYSALFNSKLLPFIKMKRLHPIANSQNMILV